MTKKSHLDKLANKKTLHETMFPKPAVPAEVGVPAPPSGDAAQPYPVAATALPKSKIREIQRSFYLPPRLLIQFQAYRLQELGIKVDSKALVQVLKEVLTQNGYWGPEYEDD